MVRRRALVVGLAGFIAACSGPAPASRTEAPAPQPTSTPKPTSVPPTASPASVSTPAPMATSAATPTPQAQVNLEVRLWNGSAEVQIDGRTIEPGQQTVDRGRHQLVALVDGEVVSLADVPPD